MSELKELRNKVNRLIKKRNYLICDICFACNVMMCEDDEHKDLPYIPRYDSRDWEERDYWLWLHHRKYELKQEILELQDEIDLKKKWKMEHLRCEMIGGYKFVKQNKYDFKNLKEVVLKDLEGIEGFKEITSHWKLLDSSYDNTKLKYEDYFYEYHDGIMTVKEKHKRHIIHHAKIEYLLKIIYQEWSTYDGYLFLRNSDYMKHKVPKNNAGTWDDSMKQVSGDVHHILGYMSTNYKMYPYDVIKIYEGDKVKFVTHSLTFTDKGVSLAFDNIEK